MKLNFNLKRLIYTYVFLEYNFLNNTNNKRKTRFELDDDIWDYNQSYKKNTYNNNEADENTATMSNLRRSPFADDLSFRRSYLKDSIEQVSVLEEEFNRSLDKEKALLVSTAEGEFFNLNEEVEFEKESKNFQGKNSDLFLDKISDKKSETNENITSNNTMEIVVKQFEPSYNTHIEDDFLENKEVNTTNKIKNNIKTPKPSLRRLSHGLSCSAFNTSSLFSPIVKQNLDSTKSESDLTELGIDKWKNQLDSSQSSLEKERDEIKGILKKKKSSILLNQMDIATTEILTQIPTEPLYIDKDRFKNNLLTVVENDEISFTPPPSPEIFKKNENVTKSPDEEQKCPEIKTTIHTVDKNTESPNLSMMTATSVVVKSARFSPQRHKSQNPLPSPIVYNDPVRKFSSTFSNQSSTKTFVSSDSQALPIKNSSNRLKSFISLDLDSNLNNQKSMSSPSNIDHVLPKLETRRASLAPNASKLIAFTPFSAKPIEFPTCSSFSRPLSAIETNVSDESLNLLNAFTPLTSPPVLSKDKTETFTPYNLPSYRRKSIVQQALAFVKMGSRKNSIEDQDLIKSKRSSLAVTKAEKLTLKGDVLKKKRLESEKRKFSAQDSYNDEVKKLSHTRGGWSFLKNQEIQKENLTSPSSSYLNASSISFFKSFFRHTNEINANNLKNEEKLINEMFTNEQIKDELSGILAFCFCFLMLLQINFYCCLKSNSCCLLFKAQ